MANVYKFRAVTVYLEKELWREFEISDNATLATFGYAVLAMFYSDGYHMFEVRCGRKGYQVLDKMELADLERFGVSDARKVKLSELGLKVGSTLSVEYDFGTSWDWKIKLKEITEMEKGSGRKYPRVTAGAGAGMLDDIAPFEVADMIAESKKTGKLPCPYAAWYNEDEDIEEDELQEWDYTDFDLEDVNSTLKDGIEYMRDAYERTD